MKVQFAYLTNGAFVAGDMNSGMTSFAYPSSPHAIVAKKYPALVAAEMIESERMSYRSIPAVQDYDCRNWKILHDESSDHTTRAVIDTIMERYEAKP